MSWTHLLPDDTTPVTAANFLAVDAGTSSTAFAWHAWWYKGLTTGPAQSRLYFRARVAGAYSGHAILDQHAIEMRLVGSDNPDSDPDFVPYVTGWQRIGTNRVFECPPMRSNTALYFEARLSPLAQHSGTTASVTWDVVPIVDEDPPWETEIVHHGILTGVGDGATSEWVISPTVVESGTPDAYANVSARQWLHLGIPHAGAAEAVELDQTDGDGATLGTGEGYFAALTQSPASGPVTVTKGVKGEAPDFPATPIADRWIAAVWVQYGAGGSVITTSDILLYPDDLRSGRFEPSAGTGLELLVNPGRTATATVTAQTSVTLPASVTRYAWVGKSGGIVLTTAATPPSAGATPVCDVTTDGSGVTAIVDRRVYAEPNAECWRLSVGGTLTVGAGVAALVAPWRGAIDRATARLWAAASGGATGSTDIALQVAGADVGTASIAAGDKVGALALTETAFEAGDLLTLDVDAITSGGTTEVGCDLHLWVCKR